MNTREAAARWAYMRARGWPAKDVDGIVGPQAEDGDHWGVDVPSVPRAVGAAPDDRPLTISGCTLLRFDDEGLVAEARDYSHAEEGSFPPPAGLFD